MGSRSTLIINGGEIYGNKGCAGAIGSQGYNATTLNSITINGGRIYDNIATCGDVIRLRIHTDLILSGPDEALEGGIWLQNNAGRRPILLTRARTKPLPLTCEGIVYRNVLIAGRDYTLTQGDLEQVQLTNELDSHYRLTLDRESNNIYIGSTQNIGTQIYWSSVGNDANDGRTRQTAVATFARAKQLLTENQSQDGDNVITVVAGTTSSTPKVITIAEDQTWSLKGIPNAYIQCDETSKGYMWYVKGATLTLEDIVIDGNFYYASVTGKTSPFRVEYDDGEDEPQLSVLNLRSGAVIRNASDDGIYAYGGIVNMYDGARITEIAETEYAIYATGTYVTTTQIDRSPTVNIYGGEFDHNARCFYPTGGCKLNIYGGNYHDNVYAGSTGGVIVNCTSSAAKVAIYGGTFTNNALTGTGANNVGTIVYGSSLAEITVVGGTFSGNTCAVDPEQNGFSSYSSSATTKPMVLTLKPDAGLDLSGVPLVYSFAAEESYVKVAGALTSTTAIRYINDLKTGQVVAMGSEGYQLTQADLAKLSLRNEGFTLKLDTAKNQIVVG